MQRTYATKAAMRARQQSNDTSNRTGTKRGDNRTQQQKKGYCRTEGKLLAKAGKLIKGLGSGKAVSASKLWSVK